MTLNVAGSMTDTLALPLLGTYTRWRSERTASEKSFGRSAAYRSLGSSTGGMPGRGLPTGVLAVLGDADCIDESVTEPGSVPTLDQATQSAAEASTAGIQCRLRKK